MRLTRRAETLAYLKCRGQVLPAAIFFLLACATFLYWTVNSGQMVTEKMRLTNAADAAAYSAGIVHARALNFDAYTNRAIVANQVAIAQTLSIVSWVDYFVDVFCNVGGLGDAVSEVSPPRPGDMQRYSKLAAFAVGDAFAQFYTGGTACTTYAAGYVAPYANRGGGYAITAFNAVSQALAVSQQVMHLPLEAALYARSKEAAQRVVDTSGPHMSVEIIPVSYDAPGFVQRYQGDDRRYLQEVVLDSRDAFTRARTWGVRHAASLQRHRIERRGGTSMPDLDTWSASDSMNHKYREFRRFRWRSRSERIGRGRAVISANEESESRSVELSQNSEGLGIYDDDLQAYYTGLPEVFDLARSGRSEQPRTTFGVSVRVRKRLADTQTSQHAALAGPSGRLAVFDAPGAPNEMAALSRAQVVFDRPPRADGRTEYANLYNPYWQVRLVQPTTADRAYAAARQGGVTLAP